MKDPLLITAATLFALGLAHTGSAQASQGRGGPPAAPTITTLAGDVQADWAIQKELLVNAAGIIRPQGGSVRVVGEGESPAGREELGGGTSVSSRSAQLRRSQLQAFSVP